jgi:hypothetical protein
MSPESSGLWRDERLYVLKTLEEVRAEQRRQVESAAIMHQEQMGRAKLDIQAAHDKIRNLENAGSTLKMKNWIITAVLSVLCALAFEVVKGYLHK